MRRLVKTVRFRLIVRVTPTRELPREFEALDRMTETTEEIAYRFVKELGETLAEGTLELPSFPDIAFRVRKVLEDPNVTSDHVAKVLSAEPVLAARLLRMANAAMMHRGGEKITDLHRAIPRLGYNMIRNAAMSLAMEQLFQARARGAIKRDLEALWVHSVRVAAISQVLAAKFTRLNVDEAFLAGLFHDIGKFYVLVRAESYPGLFSDRERLADLMARWHTGIGRAILEAWGIADAIAIAADEHEALDREHFGPPDFADVVLVANLHANLQKHGSQSDAVDWSEISAFTRLKLTPEGSIEVLKASAREIESLVDALSQ